MIPTFFAPIMLALGAWLMWRGSPLSLLCAMMALGLFEASAVAVLSALGNSSIPPARMMLGFLLIAVVIQLWPRSGLLKDAMADNLGLTIFCIYGLIGAMILPRMFEGLINVVPMRPTGLRSLLDSFPLEFTPQNVTTGVYLIGTGLTAIAAYVAGRLASDVSPLVKVGIGVALAQAITGILGVLLVHTPWDTFVDFIRNGTYAQIQQSEMSLIRVSGFMTEPSTYARVAIIWQIFATELWLRDIKPRWSGAAALALLGVMVISASSTAYVGLAMYGAVLAARFLTFPRYLTSGKVFSFVLIGAAGVIGLLALIVFSETVADEFSRTFQRMTVEKSGSESGQQRLFWAMQGIEAFKTSWGLGIGAGSFRSSSIITAIIGSMGVIGVCSFVIYCITLFRPPGRAALNAPDGRLRTDLAAASAWTALGTLYPAIVIQNSPDPGMEFAAFAGLALALRLPVWSRHPALAASGGSKVGFRGGEWGAAPVAQGMTGQPAAGWRNRPRA